MMWVLNSQAFQYKVKPKAQHTHLFCACICVAGCRIHMICSTSCKLSAADIEAWSAKNWPAHTELMTQAWKDRLLLHSQNVGVTSEGQKSIVECFLLGCHLVTKHFPLGQYNAT
jgi:hypothetical protein